MSPAVGRGEVLVVGRHLHGRRRGIHRQRHDVGPSDVTRPIDTLENVCVFTIGDRIALIVRGIPLVANRDVVGVALFYDRLPCLVFDPNAPLRFTRGLIENRNRVAPPVLVGGKQAVLRFSGCLGWRDIQNDRFGLGVGALAVVVVYRDFRTVLTFREHLSIRIASVEGECPRRLIRSFPLRDKLLFPVPNCEIPVQNVPRRFDIQGEHNLVGADVGAG